jgi:hypothetical protein
LCTHVHASAEENLRFIEKKCLHDKSSSHFKLDCIYGLYSSQPEASQPFTHVYSYKHFQE